MGFEIVWTDRALSTFRERIAYLENNFTEKEIFVFTKRVSAFLVTLKEQPLIYRRSLKIRHTHIGLIIKQVSLIYRIKSQKQVIELIAFIDNRQNPTKRPA